MHMAARERRTDLTVSEQQKYRFGITGIFIVTMAVAIFVSTSMSGIIWSMKMIWKCLFFTSSRQALPESAVTIFILVCFNSA